MPHLSRDGHEVLLVSSGAVARVFKIRLSVKTSYIKRKTGSGSGWSKPSNPILYRTIQQFRLYQHKFYLHVVIFPIVNVIRMPMQRLSELLERGILPIINENDTVSVEELTFGDNDMFQHLLAVLSMQIS